MSFVISIRKKRLHEKRFHNIKIEILTMKYKQYSFFQFLMKIFLFIIVGIEMKE